MLEKKNHKKEIYQKKKGEDIEGGKNWKKRNLHCYVITRKDLHKDSEGDL